MPNKCVAPPNNISSISDFVMLAYTLPSVDFTLYELKLAIAIKLLPILQLSFQEVDCDLGVNDHVGGDLT